MNLPSKANRGAVADPAAGGFASCPDARWWCAAFRGLRFAHPRLSPVGLRLRVHVLSGRTCILDFCEKLYPYSVLPYAPTAWLRMTWQVTGITSRRRRRYAQRIIIICLICVSQSSASVVAVRGMPSSQQKCPVRDGKGIYFAVIEVASAFAEWGGYFSGSTTFRFSAAFLSVTMAL